ncbi:MAG: hypothetical protein H6657_22775 [Ardenticatenaceae bacterium]|nr:hypothetical protein [Ardenticatenaceae bacterium]
MNWTTEQILGLAPDQFTLRAGRSAATLESWPALHHDGRILWGTFASSSKRTEETAVHQPTRSFTCTCNSRKAPCRHTMALLLLWQENQSAFTPGAAPNRLTLWAKRQTLRSQRPASNSHAQETQMTQLQTGLDELELWLTDTVRHGLARLPDRPKSYWQTMADRLVDAQAPTLAQELRRLAAVPTSQANWPDEYLQRLGRLYLIVQGFRHFDQLAAPIQADLQTAVGWLPSLHTDSTIVNDHWLVLGREQEQMGHVTHHFTWLWGQESQRPAQLIELGTVSRPEGRNLPTGTVWQGALRFLPGSWPLLAQEVDGLIAHETAVSPQGFATIREATEAHSQALACNPWLSTFPMLLHNVLPHRDDDNWRLMDASGTYLPLPDKFGHGWHLAAMAGGTPSLTLFGVWHGRIFHPLSVWHQNRWLDLHIWRGLR